MKTATVQKANNADYADTATWAVGADIANYADRAKCDENERSIVDTYATKEELAAIAGGGSSDLSGYYTKDEADIKFVPTTAYVADQQYFDGWITQNTDDIADLKESVGDIDTALDTILAIQETIVGGVN